MRDDEIPRTVKPRKPYDAQLPLIVVHQDDIFVERTGELLPIDRLPALVASEPSSYIVVHNAGKVLEACHKEFGYNPLWHYRLTPIEREVRQDDGKVKITVNTVVVNYLGFHSPGKRGKNRYHYPLDPLVFVRKSAPEIRGRTTDTLTALFEWAKDVRAFAVENNLRLSPTSGGLAAQLLRDKRFYPEDRRKVPTATNGRARGTLPGNYYRLAAEEQKFYKAVYLDQNAAHHSCARDLVFPHADRLFAKGWFDRDGWDGCDGFWSKAGTKHFAKIISQPGLFAARLRVPILPRNVTAPPYMEEPGEHTAFIYSNEIEMIQKLGGRILGLYAAWTSTVTDEGLNRYADWALEQIRTAPKETREWLKPTLLAPYGLLASKPRKIELSFLRSKSGDPALLPVGAAMMPVKVIQSTGKFEPGFANVIQRGMIEAETRKRSIELASELQSAGLEILAVYADSVFVRRNGPLPLLPKGWSVKHDLDGLRFLNAVSFTSRQLVKLPGVPREVQDRYLRVHRFNQARNSVPDKVPSDPGSSLPEVAINPTRKGVIV